MITRRQRILWKMSWGEWVWSDKDNFLVYWLFFSFIKLAPHLIHSIVLFFNFKFGSAPTPRYKILFPFSLWFYFTRHPTSKPKRTWNVRTILPTYKVVMGNAYENFLWTKIQLRGNKKLFDFLILEVSVYEKWLELEVNKYQNLTRHTQKPILGHKKFENSSNGSKVIAL